MQMDMQNIASIDILNIDKQESTISAVELISNENVNNESYIVSDADEELLILISFKNAVDLKSMKIYALSQHEKNEISKPKTIHIYKTQNTNINFEDISSMISDKTINCNAKKLNKGQNINLQKTSKNAVKFKQIKYLAIYIQSNQNDTESTFINAISLKKRSDGRKEPDLSHTLSTATKPIYNQDIVNQLTTFGYQIEDIYKAINVVTDKNNINQIMDQIEKQSPSSQQYSHCSAKNGCQSVERLIDAVIFYQTLDMNDNNNRERMIKYFNDIYKTLLDDYIHIITDHYHETNDIYNMIMMKSGMIKCDFSKCQLAIRHHRDKKHDHNDNIILDHHAIFWRDIMDSCHCFFHHLYDFGLRVKMDDYENKYDHDGNKSNVEDNDYDFQFEKLCKIIKQKTNILNKFENFNCNRYQTNKFNLNADTFGGTVEQNTSGTFMDGLYKYMKEKRVEDDHVSLLKMLVDEEEYDSDAVEMDIFKNKDQNQSNIKQIMVNESHCDLIQKYVYQIKLSSYSFKIGYRFYYWEYYKVAHTTHQESVVNKRIINVSDHSPHELYISPKYSSIKEEILHNTIYPLTNDELTVAITKSNKYIDTKKAKQKNVYFPDTSHYGIPIGTLLSSSNILSISLYTDYSELCTEFSATFRCNSEYETLSSIKTRNREFAIWSRILRETVEYFGNFGYPDNYDSYTDEMKQGIDFEAGPFFCGLSFVMVIPEFNIRLNSPTSTTKQIEVAQRFGGDTGMTLQLNNNGYEQSFRLLSFNCSWLSIYTGEDERVWCGGESPIKIETIRIIPTAKNYEKYVTALFYFDCMVSGVWMNDEFKPSHITDLYCLILQNLAKHKMEIDGYHNEYEKYVNNTFQVFTNTKKYMVINLPCIHIELNKLQNLIMYKVLPTFKNTPFKMTATRTTNLMKPILFNLFHNLKSIVILSTASIDGMIHEYEIDILSLLSILNTANISNCFVIKIVATHKYKTKFDIKYTNVQKVIYIRCSWLQLLWNRSSELIRSKCKATKFNVSVVLDGTTGYATIGSMLEDQMIIKKNT